MDKQADLKQPTATDDLDRAYYEEPPRLNAKDILGVITALFLLAVIGVNGYFWMTPGKSAADLLAFARPAEAETGLAVVPAPNAIADTAESPSDDQAALPDADSAITNAGTAIAAGGVTMHTDDEPLAGLHEHEMRCPYCGMFSEKSASHVIAAWPDGSHTHHDSWDCALYYALEADKALVGAEVSAFGSPVDNPQWLDAAEAVFLYDTKPVTGSMPPYVAAFATRAAAKAAQAELGGEMTDFAGLKAKWE